MQSVSENSPLVIEKQVKIQKWQSVTDFTNWEYIPNYCRMQTVKQRLPGTMGVLAPG